jgi:hydrogenase large subunit
MCLQNLPVEFDENGKAYLKGVDGDQPYSLKSAAPPVDETDADREARIERLVAQNRKIRHTNINPLTRVAGELGIFISADLDDRRFVDCYAQAPLFRGYEVIAMGRDPRDAIFITSRVCGVCGGVHSHASAYAIEMAMGVAPPPMGTTVRNMGEAAEMMMDNALHLSILAGVDYSEIVVRATTPSLWKKAEGWKCARQHIHHFKTMDEVMTGLNPLTGSIYRMGLEINRTGKEMFSLLHGKYPHPQTIVPTGVSTTVTLQTLNEYHTRLAKLFDGCQRMVAIYDDLTEFFYEADERYKDVGKRPVNLIDTGYWDDPHAYDADYANCNDWGSKRWATPGVLIDGKLVTTRLTDINIGMEEFVDRSYYEHWQGDRYATDPAGNPISPYHPWNKRTLPKPGAKSFKEKYTWDTAPRWDRQVVEAGAYARLFITAMAQEQPENDFMQATGTSLRMHVPKVMLPEAEMEWFVPEHWNAFERNRGRAYHMVMATLVGLNSLMEAYALYDKGEKAVATLNAGELDKAIPKEERRGVGFWGAGRGFLTHHLSIDQGKITNYQVVTPSAFNASPRDPWDQPGPYEQLVLNTPIIEEFDDPKDFTSIDMMRAVRSLDPCMPCTTHVSTGHGTVVRQVNTCECSVA